MSAPGRTEAPPAAADPDQIDPAVWRTAFTIIVGTLAVVFDTTIVSVAINDLTTALHASLSTIQWVSTGYLLAMFVTIPVAGWAQSALGGKRLWILALGVFFAGSVLCATAWNAPSLIAFRVVQGIGGGIMMPLMITMIMQAARGHNLGKVMATVSLPASLGPILGPVLGGIILYLGDWRWLFLVNVPFCLVGGWLALRNLPDDRPAPGSRTRLDVVGLLLLSPGVAAVIYGLSRVEGSAGFASAEVLAPLFAGLGLVGAFVAWALPRAGDALVNLRLFRHRSLASSSVVGFLLGITLYGALFLLPLYWQQVRGEDALGAGLLMIPQGVGTLLSRRLSGRYTDRYGPRWVGLVGFAAVALATVPFAFVTADTSKVLLMAALLVRGAGVGVATIPLTGAAYIGLGHSEIPHASIVIRVAQQLGGSMGVAVLAVVLQHAAGGAHTRAALTGAFGEAFWWSVAFTAAAVPICLLLPGPTRAAPTVDPVEVESAVPA
ncbi:MDR family MFS transporter [Pseudofrankia inefficax]|uniref:Drug resistance transporter, EmrB/QacA subfamily n=1 Tax=Pseudofrankia inefficax (strain DSM 45817 / CECT 9037 / DDB 130130 / EuI1c) TaxID=298654 RepID=E3IUA8_PSEI1|nr:MDR family MFS transporter [Pseudofrankia inefficax]ADP82445.1 drug resistance transporter, EmrB/QacA subfamily [Pseudofrankia inefficax]